MNFQNLRIAVLSAVLAGTCGIAAELSLADDWPQFLGPNRNSTSSEKGISRKWPESGPEVLWKVPVGRGFGGPAIHDGQVFLLDRDDNVGCRLPFYLAAEVPFCPSGGGVVWEVERRWGSERDWAT